MSTESLIVWEDSKSGLEECYHDHVRILAFELLALPFNSCHHWRWMDQRLAERALGSDATESRQICEVDYLSVKNYELRMSNLKGLSLGLHPSYSEASLSLSSEQSSAQRRNALRRVQPVDSSSLIWESVILVSCNTINFALRSSSIICLCLT